MSAPSPATRPFSIEADTVDAGCWLMRRWPRSMPQNAADLRKWLIAERRTVGNFMLEPIYRCNLKTTPWLRDLAAYRGDEIDQQISREGRTIAQWERRRQKKAAAAATAGQSTP